MNKLMKNGVVFAGGMLSGVVLSGCLAIRSISKSEVVKRRIWVVCSRKIEKLLYGNDYIVFGRIRAMANAGYTNTEIAGALGIPVSSVSKYLGRRDAAVKYPYKGPCDDCLRSRKMEFKNDDLVFESPGEAEMVLDQLIGIAERYAYATVEDYFELSSVIVGKRFAFTKWGWTVDMLRAATIVKTRDGYYIIKFPKPLPIKTKTKK